MSGFCLEGPAERNAGVLYLVVGGGTLEQRLLHCVKEDQTWVTSCSTHPLRPIAFGVMRSCLLQMWVGG